MVSKNSIPKAGGSSDDLIRANLRKINLSSDATLKIQIAAAQAMGLKVEYDEKTGEVSFPSGNGTLPVSVPSSEKSEKPVPAACAVDEKKLADAVKPYLEEIIKIAIKKAPIHVSPSINDVTGIMYNKKVNEDLKKMLDNLSARIEDQLVVFNGRFIRSKGRLVAEFGDDRVYQTPESEIRGQNCYAVQTQTDVKPSLWKRFLKRLWEDVTYSLWKFTSYVACVALIIACSILGYRNYRMENVIKEYEIVKTALEDDRYYHHFIEHLDSVLTIEDVDDVLDRVQKNQQRRRLKSLFSTK